MDVLPVASIVDLVNEYADRTRHAAGEDAAAYAWLDLPDALETSRTVFTVVANELHRVFASPDNAAAMLNSLADRYQIRHRLNPDGGFVWRRPSDTSSIGCAATATLINHVAQYGAKSLGTCHAHRCVDVYIDRSRAQSRSYCSQNCNDRARVARWRARRRSDRPIDSGR